MGAAGDAKEIRRLFRQLPQTDGERLARVDGAQALGEFACLHDGGVDQLERLPGCFSEFRVLIFFRFVMCNELEVGSDTLPDERRPRHLLEMPPEQALADGQSLRGVFVKGFHSRQ